MKDMMQNQNIVLSGELARYIAECSELIYLGSVLKAVSEVVDDAMVIINKAICLWFMRLSGGASFLVIVEKSDGFGGNKGESKVRFEPLLGGQNFRFN